MKRVGASRSVQLLANLSVSLSVLWPAVCCQAAVAKVIYKADGSRRGFIGAMLAPVNCRHEPRFGVRETLLVMTLVAGILALMRLLLAR